MRVDKDSAALPGVVALLFLFALLAPGCAVTAAEVPHESTSPVAQIIRELQPFLVAVVVALLSYFLWTRQHRREQRQAVVQATAVALGMYFEDATNPERRAEREKALAAGDVQREVSMRPETSAALGTQTLLVKATFW